MAVLERIQQRAKEAPRILVFSEGKAVRVFQAASTLEEEGITYPILFGSRQKISDVVQNKRISLKFQIVEPEKYPFVENVTDSYHVKCRSNGIS